LGFWPHEKSLVSCFLAFLDVLMYSLEPQTIELVINRQRKQFYFFVVVVHIVTFDTREWLVFIRIFHFNTTFFHLHLSTQNLKQWLLSTLHSLENLTIEVHLLFSILIIIDLVPSKRSVYYKLFFAMLLQAPKKAELLPSSTTHINHFQLLE
jgi:hypothetical protein